MAKQGGSNEVLLKLLIEGVSPEELEYKSGNGVYQSLDGVRR